jgi:hypothetical protein
MSKPVGTNAMKMDCSFVWKERIKGPGRRKEDRKMYPEDGGSRFLTNVGAPTHKTTLCHIAEN